MSVFSMSLTELSQQYDNLISQMMSVERRPVNRLKSKKSDLNVRSGMFSDLKTKLSALESSAETLAETGTDSVFQTAKSASTTDSDVITATASSNAAEGVYNFRVKQLATATTMTSTGELNTNPSTRSSSQVVAGSGTIDTSESFSDAGFETTPDGTITINSQGFTLSNYSTVDDFMTAINDDASANANIYYDETRDEFVIESDDASDLVINSESGTNPFFTEVNISTGTITTNNSGVESDVLLSEANFDTSVSGTGSFKINGATIDWDADADTLNDLISRINSSDAEVTAFYDDGNDKVSVTSNNTGSEEISFSDETGTFLNDTLNFSGVTQDTGNDALFTINSTDSADEITRSSNTFEINGTTFTLDSTNVTNYSDTTYDTVSVERDDEEITSQINSFLSNVNTVTSYIQTKSEVDPTTYERGGLAGQSTYTRLRTRIRSILLDEVSGIEEGKPDTLRDIGITFNDSLEISVSDSSKLSDALADNPDAVETIFNDSDDGIGTRIESLLEPYVENYGIIDDTMDSIGSQVDRIQARIEDLNDRLAQREEQLNSKFNSMLESLAMLRQQNSTIQAFQSMMGY